MAYFNQFIPFLKFLYPSYLVWNIKNKENKIYLTFDDGPVPAVTAAVLEILKQYQIKATFFCVGENVVKYPEEFKSILADGHSVGNHTYNHLRGWDTGDTIYAKNIAQCDEAMQAHHVATKLFRPPYGKASRKQLHAVSKSHKVIMWNVLSGDFDANQSPEKCFKEAISHTSSGSIVIFHDSYKAEKNLLFALPQYIDWCLKQGFQFDKL
jgi:peptidoglycan-N-acetylglucosamine deacetylase